MSARSGRRPERRAPRLDARTHLGRYLRSRTGRFAAVDPLRGKPLPRLSRILGLLGWAGLLGESLRRARSRIAAEDASGDGARDDGDGAPAAATAEPLDPDESTR